MAAERPQTDDESKPELNIIQAIELATWAPNGGNQQNWRFYIIKNKATLKKFADAVQAASDLINSWPEAAKFINLDQSKAHHTVISSPTYYCQFVPSFDIGFFSQVFRQYHLAAFIHADYRLNLTTGLVVT
jgi:nitroreductase